MEYVPAPAVPIPPQLTADCEQVEIPDDLTFGGAVELLADAMKSIADCNHDKRAIIYGVGVSTIYRYFPATA